MATSRRPRRSCSARRLGEQLRRRSGPRTARRGSASTTRRDRARRSTRSARRARRPRRARPGGRARRAAARDQGRGRGGARSAPPRSSPTRRCSRCSGAGSRGAPRREVALDLEVAMRRRGAQALSFPPIVARGRARRAAARRAARRGDRAGRARDDRLGLPARRLLLGLHAHVRGRRASSDEARAVYDLVLRAAGGRRWRRSRPGADGRDGRRGRARRSSARRGHGEHFGHGLGHGVGLEVHEGPRLSRTQRVDAAPRAWSSRSSPGVYLPGPARRADRGPRARHGGRARRAQHAAEGVPGGRVTGGERVAGRRALRGPAGLRERRLRLRPARGADGARAAARDAAPPGAARTRR